jgi:hypothetical protein
MKRASLWFMSACALAGASALFCVSAMTLKARWRRASRRCAHDHHRMITRRGRHPYRRTAHPKHSPRFPGCFVGADDEPELEEPLVANLQEQASAEVVLKTLGTGLHPRRSKSLATFCSPAIPACSFRALMLTGTLTDDDASRRQTAPRLQPIAHAVRRQAYKKQPPVDQRPFASRRGCTASEHRSTAIVEEAIARLSPLVRDHLNSTSTADTGSRCADLWRAGGCDSRGVPSDGSPASPWNGNERGNILAEYVRFALGDRDGRAAASMVKDGWLSMGSQLGQNEGHKLVSSSAR